MKIKKLNKKKQDKKDLEEFLKMVRGKRISPFHMSTIREEALKLVGVNIVGTNRRIVQ